MARPRDEWYRVIQKQSEDAQRVMQQERDMALQSKRLYRDQLNQQMAMKQQVKTDSYVSERQADQQDIQQKNLFAHQHVATKRQENLQMKGHLAQQYDAQRIHADQVKKAQHEHEIVNEQQQLVRIREQLQSEEQRKKAIVDQRKQQEESVRQFFRQRKEQERQFQDFEKVQEQERIAEYNQLEVKRLQDRQNFLQQKNGVVDAKMQNYNSIVNPAAANKRMEENMRLRNQAEQKQKMEKEKFEIEREIKFANMRSVNEENAMLIQHKQNQKKMEHDRFLQEAREVRENEQRVRELELQRMEEQRQIKQQYNSHLGAQVGLSKQLRDTQFNLTEAEKRLNRHYLDGIPVSRTPGLSASVDISRNRQDNQFQRDMSNFYGATPQVSNRGEIPRATSQEPTNVIKNMNNLNPGNSGSGGSLADRFAVAQQGNQIQRSASGAQGHNPITLPVGAHIPRPGDRPLYNPSNNFSPQPLANHLRANDPKATYFVNNF